MLSCEHSILPVTEATTELLGCTLQNGQRDKVHALLQGDLKWEGTFEVLVTEDPPPGRGLEDEWSAGPLVSQSFCWLGVECVCPSCR